MRPLGIFCLVGLVCVFFGCAAKPEIDVYIEPVAGREGAEVNQKFGSVSIEQDGVAIRFAGLIGQDLHAVFKRFFSDTECLGQSKLEGLKLLSK